MSTKRILQGVAIASLLCSLTSAQKDSVPTCSDSKACCAGNLSSFGILGPSTVRVYGDKTVQLHPRVQDLPSQKKNCHEIPMFVQDEGDVADSGLLYDHCSSKCNEKDISIMSGTGWFGLNLKDGLDVCLGSSDTMPAKLEEWCSTEEATVCNVEEATSNVVSSLLRVTYSSLAKKSAALGLVAWARDEALNEENQELLQDKTDSEMALEILRIYSTILERFSSNDGSLSYALNQLGGDIQVVKDNFDRDFDNFMKSITQCNKMIPRTDSNQSVFYDVCSQQSTQCIEHPEAEHVSCCCVYNPMAQLPGLFLDKPLDLSACTFFDLCSQIRREASTWLQPLVDQIHPSIYSAFEESLKIKYGDSFRPLNLSFPNRSTAALYTGVAKALPSQKQVDGCASRVPLQNLSSTLPPTLRDAFSSYRNLNLVYDFEGHISDNYCDARYENRADALFDRCEEFCGGASVPLLIGSPKSGVRPDQALSVCFDDKVVGGAELQEFCAGTGRDTLEHVQAKVAELASNLGIFRASQLAFVELVRRGADDVRAAADSAELKGRIQRQNTKAERVEAYKDFYREQFAGVHRQADVLVAKGAQLKRAFEELKTFVDAAVPDLHSYAANCSRGFPRTAGGEAMLALCPVSGSVCAEDPRASYVYCCCSTNAIAAAQDVAIDVCSHAKNMSTQALAELKQGLDSPTRRDGASAEVPGTDFASRYYAGMSLRYGDTYDPPMRLVQTETYVDGDADSLATGADGGGGNQGTRANPVDQGDPDGTGNRVQSESESGPGEGGFNTIMVIGAVGGVVAAILVGAVAFKVLRNRHCLSPNKNGGAPETKSRAPSRQRPDTAIFWDEAAVAVT